MSHIPTLSPAEGVPIKTGPNRPPLSEINIHVEGLEYLRQIQIMKRPGFGTRGKKARVNINAFAVIGFPSMKIYQYDVSIGGDGTKRALIKKVWHSEQLQKKLGQRPDMVIFDGVRLAWSPFELPIGTQLTMMVDLDEGTANTAKKAMRDNKHRVVIRKASIVPMEVLGAYLEKKIPFDKEVLICINFLDHLLRETPASKFVTIKRSFFQNSGARLLPGGVEAWRGIFQSIRVADGGRLIMNVDVATSVFWCEGGLSELACRMLKLDNTDQLCNKFTREGPKGMVAKQLRKLKKIQFFCKHRHSDLAGPDGIIRRKVYTVEGFGDNAENTKFDRRVFNNKNEESTVTVSVRQYYLDNYNIRLRYPALPLVKTRKKGEFYPMELCFVGPGQRYPYKLDDKQTADMIKFTVTRPSIRLNQIKDNVNQLEWDKDPALIEYGMQMRKELLVTEARLLPTPQVKYGNETITPREGKWDLRGKKFVQFPKTPLRCWGILVFNSPREVPDAAVKNFARAFVQAYNGHGGVVEQKMPPVAYADSRKSVAANVFEFFKTCGNERNTKPEILMFILATKSSQPYGDIKGYCDINIGVPSQCLQTKHVLAAKPQYCSNVCMKFNAKLGGSTHYLDMKSNPLSAMKEDNMMFLGADVSHSSPGHKKTSYASMVGTTDLQATRYAAVADTNGSQVEIIVSRNTIRFMMMLLRIFRMSTGKIPRRIMYFRDGVSEGQYDKIIDQEYTDMIRACHGIQNGYRPFFSIIVCSKRHHFRFFPIDKHAMDKNSNPLPGVIVDRDITSPEKYDFYLNSHSALQGTSRPVHYQVIQDDNKIPTDSIQALIYNYCYTYIRSTTAVSLVPAAYYAHLASARSRLHEGVELEMYTVSSSDPLPRHDPDEVVPLKILHEAMRPTMWFV